MRDRFGVTKQFDKLKGEDRAIAEELHTIFLPLAKRAKIPANKTRDFAIEIAFIISTAFGRAPQTEREYVRRLRAPIRRVLTASKSLHKALEYLDDCEDGLTVLGFHFHSWGPNRIDKDGDPLRDFRCELLILKAVAESLLHDHDYPAEALIVDTLVMVDRFGGELSYDKNSHSGGLAEFYEFFRDRMPAEDWKDLSPSTLQRLKTSVARLTALIKSRR